MNHDKSNRGAQREKEIGQMPRSGSKQLPLAPRLQRHELRRLLMPRRISPISFGHRLLNGTGPALC